MLTLGLADLKGHVGISFDDGAWLDSAFNASPDVHRPFTVYLGGLLGPRRILLFAASIFALTCSFLPLVHSHGLLITMLIVAGLTSGNFLPTNADVRTSQHSTALPTLYDCSLRNFCGRCGKYRPFALRLVSRSSVLAMDCSGTPL